MRAERCREADEGLRAAAAEAADARALRDDALAHAKLCEGLALEAARGNTAEQIGVPGLSQQQRPCGGAAASVAASLREADASATAAEADSRERERRIMELLVM